MQKKVRWGILGAGTIARLFAQGLQSLPDARLLAVASRTPRKLEEYAGRFPVQRTYHHYEELIADKDVDIVYIGTTANTHKAFSLLCLQAGKPVLCEKPFTTDAAQAREVIALARRRRIFCMEAMWMRFLPLMSGLRNLLDANVIGEVHMVAADFGVRAPSEAGSRFFDPDLGGGAMLDFGIYPLSFASFVLGTPETVHSMAVFGSTGVDEQASAILGYPSGKLAVISSSLIGHSPTEAWIVGTKGRIRVHPPLYRPCELSLHLFPEPQQPAAVQKSGMRVLLERHRWVRGMARRAKAMVSGAGGRGSRPQQYPFVGNGYNYEANEAMRCLKEGRTESSLMPLEETLRIMETMDAIRSQWAEKHPAKSKAG